jgi:hypothetical protein
MLFHSLRILLSNESASAAHTLPATLDNDDVRRSSARIIISIVRRYRSQCSLKYAPFTFMYGIAQALSVVACDGIPEEHAYLLKALEECSATWSLAGHVKTRVLGRF